MNDLQRLKSWIAGLPDDAAVEYRTNTYSANWEPIEPDRLRAICTMPTADELADNIRESILRPKEHNHVG